MIFATPALFTAKSGAFIQGQQSVGTSATLGANNLRLVPFLVTQRITITGIGTEFTVAGDAASLFRLTIYADDGTGYPGALLLDGGSISTGSGNAGTVATAGTPGVYVNSAIAPLVLQPGLYWIGGSVQGVTVTQPTMRTGLFQAQFAPSPVALPAAGATGVGYLQSGVSGNPPNPFEAFASSGIAGTAARVLLQLQ